MWVKREVGHANFLSWLAENIQAFNRVTAAKYMDYVKRCELAGEVVPYLKCTNVVHLEPTEPIPDGKYATIVMAPRGRHSNWTICPICPPMIQDSNTKNLRICLPRGSPWEMGHDVPFGVSVSP